jgi:energy-coupling factor transport system permease protein
MIGSAPRFLSYRVGTTLLHRLDSRTKLLGTAVVVANALFASVPQGMIVAYALGAIAVIAAASLFDSLWRVLRPLIVLVFSFGILIVIVTPGKAFAHFWIIAPSYDGVQLAIQIGLQAFLIISTTSLLSITTPPLAVADSLEWALGWLQRFRVPIRDIIAMVGIGLTFVPLLIAETQKVIAAQRARGADIGFNALLEEEAMGALLIPLLLANLRRGEELAESMEARLYATGPRGSLSQPHFGRLDAYAAAILAVFTAINIIVSFVIW